MAKMNFANEKFYFNRKSHFNEPKCAVKGHSINRDLTVYVIQLQHCCGCRSKIQQKGRHVYGRTI